MSFSIKPQKWFKSNSDTIRIEIREWYTLRMMRVALTLGILGMLVGGGYWFFFVAIEPTPPMENPLASVDLFAAQGTSPPPAQSGQAPPAQNPAQSPAPITSPINSQPKKVMQATLRTNKGDITIEFMAADAPNTVANFTKLATDGFYTGTKFHRVIEGFMIQGGDPLTKDDGEQARWGTGGPGYKFADEIHANNLNAIGTISMANSGPNTNGSQFFINVADNNFLDPKHTVFGKVISGMEVVAAITKVETTATDRPLEAIVINSIDLK